MLTIGIAGGTGSGKTTVVNNILENIDGSEVNVISQDNYYKDNSGITLEEREKLNYDHPNSIDFELLIDHVQKLKKGKTVEEPIYSFLTHTRTSETQPIHPKKILIIEGILVLAQPELRKEIDLKVFVYADSDERLIRRLRRDIQERGRDMEEVINRYQTTLKPMHEQFIEPSMQYADIIVPNMKRNPKAVNVLTSVIQKNL